MRFAVYYLCIFAAISRTECISYMSEHSLSSPYNEENTQISEWSFIDSKPFLDYIQLTPAEPNVQGAIWNRMPCIRKDWEFQVTFQIQGQSPNSFGNGMAIWYTKDAGELGPVFGSKNHFSGLGVFIDTFEDPEDPHEHRHPYISAMVSNGSQSYGHDEEGTFYELGGCHAMVRNMNYELRIAVSYSEDSLTVYLDTEGERTWLPCFSSYGVHLPTGYHFGVSANTGEIPDYHAVLLVIALDLTVPGQPIYDRSGIMPWAENSRQREEQPEHVELDEGRPFDEPQVVKREVVEPEPEPEVVQRREPEPEVVQRRVPEPEVVQRREPEPEVVQRREPEPEVEMKREEKPKAQQQKPDQRRREKITEERPRKRSWWYTAFVVVVLVVALVYGTKWCRQYRARRREIMQKRLY